MDMAQGDIERLLRATGEQLGKAGEKHALVVVGGAALSLLGIVSRTTADIDVIATWDKLVGIAAPDPLLPAGQTALLRVARDFGLPPTWMNTTVATQWRTGLPPGFGSSLTWREFAALRVGLPSRTDLMALKLYVAADQHGPANRHFNDLLALQPTRGELQAAADWVLSQDASASWPEVVQRVVDHVIADTR